MDLSLFKSAIDQVHKNLFYLNLYFQGEPYLDPDFFDMVQYARNHKIFVNTSTNGHFLDPENARRTVASGLNRIIISLDGTDQESYGSYRIGGSFEKVKQGITDLVHARKEMHSKTPRIIVQFLVLKTNEHQVPEIRKLVKELGADALELKSAQLYHFEYGNPLLTSIEKYRRYQMVNKSTSQRVNESTWDSLKIKNRLPNHCFRMWSSCVITWDGRVAPCCFDKDVSFPMGNIEQLPVRAIWKNKEYNHFRQRILDERKSIDICRNCTEGMGISSIF
jgi:radical SAM protein with 4Fe4S-binding SPASM domain